MGTGLLLNTKCSRCPHTDFSPLELRYLLSLSLIVTALKRIRLYMCKPMFVELSVLNIEYILLNGVLKQQPCYRSLTFSQTLQRGCDENTLFDVF